MAHMIYLFSFLASLRIYASHPFELFMNAIVKKKVIRWKPWRHRNFYKDVTVGVQMQIIIVYCLSTLLARYSS